MSDVSDAEPDAGVVVDDEEEVNDLMTAVKKVLKNAAGSDGLVRGLHGVAKVLDAKKAHVCFLAENCSEPAYIKLVEGLCKELKIPLVHVPESKQLGEWSGLCKIDPEGKPRKVVGASCVAVTDFGEESEGLNFLQNHMKTLKT